MINLDFVKLVASLFLGWGVVTLPALILALSRRDLPNREDHDGSH